MAGTRSHQESQDSMDTTGGGDQAKQSWEGKSFFTTKTGWWQLKYFLFSSLPREMIHFDEHIFQVGWNHQLEKMRGVFYCFFFPVDPWDLMICDWS